MSRKFNSIVKSNKWIHTIEIVKGNRVLSYAYVYSGSIMTLQWHNIYEDVRTDKILYVECIEEFERIVREIKNKD